MMTSEELIERAKARRIEWVTDRAEEWAEWVEKGRAGGSGSSNGVSSYAEFSGGGDSFGHSIDFVLFDHQRCAAFERAVNALPVHLGVVFKMHWLGSESVTVDTSAAVKAGLCGVSRAGYYRRIEEANELIYNDLH